MGTKNANVLKGTNARGEGRDRVIVRANDWVDPAGGCERVIRLVR